MYALRLTCEVQLSGRTRYASKHPKPTGRDEYDFISRVRTSSEPQRSGGSPSTESLMDRSGRSNHSGECNETA